jgi:1-deoxy-D-xylulose-5-phosphate synthase
MHALSKIETVKEKEAKPVADKSSPPSPNYSKVFGDWLCLQAEHNELAVGITPAMGEGSGMKDFAERFPNRFHDVAIAEQHAVTFAAGMACDGLKPVVAIYSTFLQRAYDQLIHDVALQNLDVMFAIDRAGLVGEDGPTHAGSFDLSYLRCIPNMIVMAPSDEAETFKLLSTGFEYKGPTAVRYPRGKGPGARIPQSIETVAIGKGISRREGKTIAILAFGSMVQPALAAAEELNATVIDMRFVKPLDEELIGGMATTHQLIVTVEENTVLGGAGSAVNEFLLQENHQISVLNLGLPDKFLDHGKVPQMLENAGLDSKSITKAIQTKLQACKIQSEAV